MNNFNHNNNKPKQPKKKASIAKALTEAFGFDFLIALPLKLIYDASQFGGPIFLSLFLTYAENFKTSKHARKQGILLFFVFSKDILAHFMYTWRMCNRINNNKKMIFLFAFFFFDKI